MAQKDLSLSSVTKKHHIFSPRATRILAGMVLCWLMFALYWFIPKSHENIIASTHPSSDSSFASDTYSYIHPEHSNIWRQAGYPFFINSMKRLAGSHWIVLLLILQTAVISMVYWAVEILADEFFTTPFAHRWILWTLMLAAGTYYTYTGLILTDALFASLFLLGLAWGLKKQWGLFLLCIGLAAQIRPSLMLFPAVWLVILYTRNQLHLKSAKVSLVLLIVLTQLPCLKNVIDHGRWTPTNVMQINIQIWKRTVSEHNNNAILGTLRTSAGATLCTPWVDHVTKLFGYTENTFAIQLLRGSGIGFWVAIWMLFLIYTIRKKRIDLLVWVGSFILPALVAGGGARMRLPFEPILLICAIEQLSIHALAHKPPALRRGSI